MDDMCYFQEIIVQKIDVSSDYRLKHNASIRNYAIMIINKMDHQAGLIDLPQTSLCRQVLV